MLNTLQPYVGLVLGAVVIFGTVFGLKIYYPNNADDILLKLALVANAIVWLYIIIRHIRAKNNNPSDN